MTTIRNETFIVLFVKFIKFSCVGSSCKDCTLTVKGKEMKLSRILLSAVAVATVAACGNLSKVTEAGTPEYKEVDGQQVPQLVWPKIDKAGFNHDGSQFGSWPNWDNVRMIERGMNKDQLYNLIGRPHFSEGLYGVEEWDYAFNYRENGVHKICQYKILFDKTTMLKASSGIQTVVTETQHLL